MNEIHSDTAEYAADTLFGAEHFDDDGTGTADGAADIDDTPEPEGTEANPTSRSSPYASCVVRTPLAVDSGAPPAELDQELLFRQLMAQHERRLYRFVIKYIDHPDDAADITQQAFVEAARTIASFRGDSKLSTWLFGIAMNMVRNYQIARYTVTGTVYSAIMKEMTDSLKGTANKIG